MFQKKRYVYLTEAEYSILAKSLVQLKNKLIQQNRFTDCVDELYFHERLFRLSIVRPLPDRHL